VSRELEECAMGSLRREPLPELEVHDIVDRKTQVPGELGHGPAESLP